MTTQKSTMPDAQKIGTSDVSLELESADEHEQGEMSIDSALELVGFGRFQVMTTAICGMAWFVDAVEVGGLPYVYVTLDHEWGTDTNSWGVLSSAKSLASVLGALLFGVVADRFGRRPAFLGALAVTSMAGSASAAASNFYGLLVFRCFTDLGAGGLLPVGISLLSENLPPSRRETCVVLMQIFFVSGHVLSVLFAMALVPTGMWRLFLLALAGPPTVLLLTIARQLPESPVFLQQSGQLREAQEALDRMRMLNGLPAWEVRVSRDATETAGAKQPMRGLALIVSRWALGTRVIAFGLLWAFAMMGGDWVTWATEIGSIHGSSEYSVQMFMMIMQLMGIFGFLLAARLALGGRGPCVLRGALVGATASALSAALLVRDHMSTAFLCAVLSLGLAYNMVWSLLYATTAAAFDPRCRASALSVTTCFSRTAASVTPLISGFLLHQYESGALLFWASAYMCATCLALAINFTNSTST